MSLADIQHKFMCNLIQSKQVNPDFISQLVSVGKLTQEKQLSIYRANVSGAHQKVLAQIYPACLNILGEDYFNQCCLSFNIEYPSMQADLNFYGEAFPEFIRKKLVSNDELVGYEYLAGLALLEWHWHTSYYAKNDGIFSFEQFALVEPEEQGKSVFTLSDSFSLHASSYPLLEIWDANKKTIDSIQEFEPPDEELHFCITKEGYFPSIKKLSDEEYKLLNSIVNGLSLTQLIENDIASLDGFQNKLVRFIQNGWITGFSFSDADVLAELDES